MIDFDDEYFFDCNFEKDFGIDQSEAGLILDVGATSGKDPILVWDFKKALDNPDQFPTIVAFLEKNKLKLPTDAQRRYEHAKRPVNSADHVRLAFDKYFMVKDETFTDAKHVFLYFELVNADVSYEWAPRSLVLERNMLECNC